MDRLALDACVLINICATDRIRQIAETLQVRFMVPREVAGEAFCLRPRGGGGEPCQPIELEALVTDQVLEIVDLQAQELITFVASAERLDDGEAAALAVALHRDLALATDDRAALRLIAAEHASLEVVSTSQLMRRFCEQAQVPAAAAAESLAAIEERANFVPPASDSEAEWWGMTRHRVASG